MIDGSTSSLRNLGRLCLGLLLIGLALLSVPGAYLAYEWWVGGEPKSVPADGRGMHAAIRETNGDANADVARILSVLAKATEIEIVDHPDHFRVRQKVLKGAALERFKDGFHFFKSDEIKDQEGNAVTQDNIKIVLRDASGVVGEFDYLYPLGIFVTDRDRLIYLTFTNEATREVNRLFGIEIIESTSAEPSIPADELPMR